MLVAALPRMVAKADGNDSVVAAALGAWGVGDLDYVPQLLRTVGGGMVIKPRCLLSLCFFSIASATSAALLLVGTLRARVRVTGD